jgi:flavin-dependent dehydrogenase
LPPEFLKKYSLFGAIKKANMRWRLFRPVCREGVILCGDAAGVLDPAAGQGILNSLCSGIKAAQGVIACLETPEYENIILAQYDDWFYEQYASKVESLSEYYRKHGIDVLSHA